MWEGEAHPPIVMRLAADDGFNLNLSDPDYGIAQVDLKVRDAYDPLETVIITKTYTGYAQLYPFVFDSLQGDGYAFDDVGYNFRHQLPASETTGFLGGRSYTFEYKITGKNLTTVPIQVHVAWIQVMSTGY